MGLKKKNSRYNILTLRLSDEEMVLFDKKRGSTSKSEFGRIILINSIS